MGGIASYNKVKNRPKKRAIQQELYGYAAKFLQRDRVTVVDLPNVRPLNCIRDMCTAGVPVGDYYGYERDKKVYDQIKHYGYRPTLASGHNRPLLRHKDVVEDLATSYNKNMKFPHQKVGLFNLDFCGSVTMTLVPKILKGISQHMDERTAVVLTFCPRGTQKPKATEVVKQMFCERALEIYGMKKAGAMLRSYRDWPSASMCSWCYILEKA